MVDAGDHDAVARLEGVRPIIEYQFHAARKDDVEVEGVGVVHRELRVPLVLHDEPAGQTGCHTEVEGRRLSDRPSRWRALLGREHDR
jgi:hypothetical protein